MKISIVLGGRNDDYGGKELFSLRHKAFISYHTYYFKKFLLDYEIVIIDYNPVPKKKSFIEEFNWDEFNNVIKIEVSNLEHKKLTRNSEYPYFGNIVFNKGATFAQGNFLLALNVDSYLSPELIEYLSYQNLDKNYFFRTDLIYFKQKYFRNPIIQSMWNRNTKLKCARRHASSQNSKKLGPENLLDPKINLVNRYRASEYVSHLNLNELEYPSFFSTLEWPKFPVQSDQVTNWLTASGLHTNASGDFILLPKEAFYEVGGFSEDPTWNLHNDSHFLLKLVKEGYKQILFKYPLVTYHVDHERGGWQGMAQISYEEWCNLVVEMLNS